MILKKDDIAWHEFKSMHNQVRFMFDEIEYKPKESTVIIFDKANVRKDRTR